MPIIDHSRDPRNDQVTPFAPPKKDENADFDFFGTAALVMGPLALLLKYRELALGGVGMSISINPYYQFVLFFRYSIVELLRWKREEEAASRNLCRRWEWRSWRWPQPTSVFIPTKRGPSRRWCRWRSLKGIVFLKVLNY
jgi:hypothetical protein